MVKTVRRIIGLAVLLLLCAPIFLIVLGDQSIQDRISTIGYHHPAAIAKIESDLQLADAAKLVFLATRPTLHDREQFNQACRSFNDKISVLGCFDGQHIHLFSVDAKELSGVIESTSAHELLHAIWRRLPASEKNDLGEALEEFYHDHADTLEKELAIYNQSDRIDELHSRVGTQFAELPPALEKHYARYFIDQDRVVKFYNSYREPFEKLSQELAKTTEELKSLKSSIDEKSQDYESMSASLTAEISEFNRCADASGCFSSQWQFVNRRRVLISEQDELNQLYQQINTEIEQYNAMVERYNANVINMENLQQEINSNAKIEQVIE